MLLANSSAAPCDAGSGALCPFEESSAAGFRDANSRSSTSPTTVHGCTAATTEDINSGRTCRLTRYLESNPPCQQDWHHEGMKTYKLLPVVEDRLDTGVANPQSNLTSAARRHHELSHAIARSVLRRSVARRVNSSSAGSRHLRWADHRGARHAHRPGRGTYVPSEAIAAPYWFNSLFAQHLPPSPSSRVFRVRVFRVTSIWMIPRMAQTGISSNPLGIPLRRNQQSAGRKTPLTRRERGEAAPPPFSIPHRDI